MDWPDLFRMSPVPAIFRPARAGGTEPGWGTKIMPKTSIQARAGQLSVLAVLVGVGVALASGATFDITGQGVRLSAAKEDGDLIRLKARAELGKPFTLVAQGMVLPRGGKPQPGEPDAGTWAFDEKHFKKLSPDGKAADKTKVAIRLEPTAAGTSRVRFVGKILGYERKFEVEVEVVGRKKE